MDESKTVAILSALAHGVNPTTGEVFGSDSPYQQADVVRALFAALDRFKQASKQTSVPKQRVAAAAAIDSRPNAGKPWSDEEDRRLLEQFDRGLTPADLARDLGRTVAGIEARLERHGRLSAAERTTANRYPRQRSPGSEAGVGSSAGESVGR